jgi:general stress protein 26
MERNLQEKVEQVLDQHPVGTMATVRNDKPYSRYMTFFHDDLTLYTATNEHTHKVEDLRSNPNAHILVGQNGTNEPHIEIEAKAEIEDSPQLKEKYWDESLRPWISGPDDSEYVLLRLQPQTILYYESPGSEPQEMTFPS